MSDPFQGLSSLGGAATRYFNRSRKDPLERLIREMQNQQELQRLQHEGRRRNVQATQNVTNDGYVEALQMPVVNPVDEVLLSPYQEAIDANQISIEQLANDQEIFDKVLNPSSDHDIVSSQGIVDDIALQQEMLDKYAPNPNPSSNPSLTTPQAIIDHEQQQALLEQPVLLAEQDAAIDQAQRFDDYQQYQDQIAAAQSDVLSAPLASQQEILARIVADRGAFPSVDQSFEDSLTLNAGDRVNQARVVNEFTRTLQDQEGGATPEQLQFAARNKPALIAVLQRRAYNDPEFYKKNRALFDKIGVKPVAGTATATAQGKAEQTEVINMLQGGVVTPELEQQATRNPQLVRSSLAFISTDNLNPQVTRFLQQKNLLGNPKGAKATKELPDRYLKEFLDPEIPFSEEVLQHARENPRFASDAIDRYILVGEKKNQLIAAANLKVDTPARVAAGKKLTKNEVSILTRSDIKEALDAASIENSIAFADKNPELAKREGLDRSIGKARAVVNTDNVLAAMQGMKSFGSLGDNEYETQAIDYVNKKYGKNTSNISSAIIVDGGGETGDVEVKFKDGGAEQLIDISMDNMEVDSMDTMDEFNETLSGLKKEATVNWDPLIASAKTPRNKQQLKDMKNQLTNKIEGMLVQRVLPALREDIDQELKRQLKIDTNSIDDFDTLYDNLWAERSRGFTTREDLETFKADVRDQWANK